VAPGSKFTKIAAGVEYGLALNEAGTVVAWGDNGYGACDVPEGLNGVVAIVAGGGVSVAVTDSGSVAVWGLNDLGQCNLPSGLSGVVSVAVLVGGHVLALKGDGTVVAWGNNGAGQCNVPSGLNTAMAITAGWYHSVALLADGTVVAWGDNFYGQLDVPTGLSDVVAISAAGNHTVALKRDGTVVEWGADYVGVSPGSPYWPPAPLPSGLSGVVRILASYDNAGLALKADGTVAAWGQSALAIPSDLTDVVAIDGSPYWGIAVKRDGTVVDWGLPSAPPGLSGVVAVATDGNFALALKNDGTVVTWGDNSAGECNGPNPLTGVVAVNIVEAGPYPDQRFAVRDDETVTVWGSAPTDFVPDLTGVIAVAAPIALKADGTVTGWGNWQGGEFERKPGIAFPADLSGVIAINAGDYFMALKSDGTIAMWGYEIAVGDYSFVSSLSGIVAIATDASPPFHHLALKADGTVVAWGDDAFGESDLPAGLGGVVAIAAGGGWTTRHAELGEQLYTAHSLALKADGTVAAWGDDTYGQCDVPEGLDHVVAIAAGSAHSLALRNDGTVAAWGRNDYGQCNVPSDLTGVVAIAAGGSQSIAIYSSVNHPPQAANYVLATLCNTPASMPLLKLQRACSDPDGDSVIITGISPNSAAGGTAQFSGSTITYTPPQGFVGVDSFTYTVLDCRGASAQGTVNVTVKAPSGNGLNIINVSVAPGGAATIQCAGIPGVTYVLEASTDLVQWTQLTSATAGANGLFVLIDSQAGNFTSRYYRTSSNPEAP
jgi:alpha-tubulin suppressor-like RCC1 family protein